MRLVLAASAGLLAQTVEVPPSETFLQLGRSVN